MRRYLLLFLFVPAISLAEGSYTRLEKGQETPFAGVLLTPEAASTMIAEKEAAAKKAKLESDIKCQRKQAELEKKIGNLTIDKNSAESEVGLIEEIKTEEIERLRELIKNAPNDYTIAWYAGGVVSGIALSLAIFYLSVQTVAK